MLRFPSAKINLGLYVTEKRADGYHNIETLFVPIALRDVLEVIPSTEFSFQLYGLSVAGETSDNLCVRAYQLLCEEFKLPPVKIYLYKNIPTGAGLGGGSSDGAAMLMLLNELFSLQLSTAQLENYAARLGCDCPFFVHHKPMFATGRGEILKAAPDFNLPNCWIVLIKPPVFVSTAEAYSNIVPKFPCRPLLETLAEPFEKWKNELTNDFENSVFARYPLLAQIKKQCYDCGASYAAMSGSGSAIFGLFSDETKATAAAQNLPYVIWQGRL